MKVSSDNSVATCTDCGFTMPLNASNGSIDALLKRGCMALEDGEWTEADGFFEDVLNQNAECAEAYLGKALVQEKQTSLEALAHARITISNKLQPVYREINADLAHIDRIVEENVVPGYLDDDVLREKYNSIDRHYPAFSPAFEEQLHSEQLFWDQHRQLSRARRFAQGDIAQALEQAKSMVINQFVQWVKEARSQDAREKDGAVNRYQVCLA